MEFMSRMNKKLDIGWKMTNSSCQKCNGVSMADPNNITEYYCPKCDKMFEFGLDQIQVIEVNQREIEMNQRQSGMRQLQTSNQSEEDYFNQIISEEQIFQKPKVSSKVDQMLSEDQFPQSNYRQIEQKSNMVSKKIGQKLLQGWAMLEQCCMECNVPLMRSKIGEKICFGCGKDFSKPEVKKIQKKDNIMATPLTILPSVHLSPIKSKVEQVIKPKVQKSKSKCAKSCKQSTIQRIESKALQFFQQKMDKAISENDLAGVQKILSLIKRLKK